MPKPAFTETMQIGIVVRDLDAAIRRYEEGYGNGTRITETPSKETGYALTWCRSARAYLAPEGSGKVSTSFSTSMCCSFRLASVPTTG